MQSVHGAQKACALRGQKICPKMTLDATQRNLQDVKDFDRCHSFNLVSQHKRSQPGYLDMRILGILSMRENWFQTQSFF